MNKTFVDVEAARELALYIENDYQLYAQYIVPYIQSLHKKRERARMTRKRRFQDGNGLPQRGRKCTKTNF